MSEVQTGDCIDALLRGIDRKNIKCGQVPANPGASILDFFGTEMAMPGDNVEMSVELITLIAIEAGLRFAVREGGHIVGAGLVTEIIE